MSHNTHLGLHSAKSHDLLAVDYRIKHGLRRSKGLVATATRETQRVNAKNRYTENGPLATTRDLLKANAARLGAARPASAEEAAQRDARLSNMPRPSHARRVVTCEQCGVQFCPILANISKRRFCGMSCSNRATRNATLARQRAEARQRDTDPAAEASNGHQTPSQGNLRIPGERDLTCANTNVPPLGTYGWRPDA